MPENYYFSTSTDIDDYIKDEDLNNLIRRARDFQLFDFSSYTHGNLSKIPKLQTAIVACIDCRILVEKLFKLEIGEAVVIRTAGNVIDLSVIKNLILSIYELSVNKIILLGHKDCGMKMTDSDFDTMERNIYVKSGLKIEEFNKKLHNSTDFRTYISRIKDPIQNMQLQLKKLYLMQESRVIPDNVIIRGYLYDEKEGTIEEIKFEIK